jgi:hypothetical protein
MCVYIYIYRRPKKVYNGHWVHDKMEGKGSYMWPNCAKYNGEFVQVNICVCVCVCARAHVCVCVFICICIYIYIYIYIWEWRETPG